MEWLEEAHKELTPRPVPPLKIVYSGRFKGYNASVTYQRGAWMTFKLSMRWAEVDPDIQKGVVQHLIVKAYRLKKTTRHMELYEEFLRQASRYAPRKQSDPYLVERFTHLNETYFNGLLEQPNLVFGSFSTTKLGSYEYGTDTVSISTAMKDDEQLLDYVLYHELLHKKHQFSCNNGRTHHHTAAFRRDEKRFLLADADKKLDAYVAVKRREKKAASKARKKQSRPLWQFWR